MKRILLYGLEEEAADRTQNVLEGIGVAAYIIGDDVLDEELDRVFDAKEDFDGRHREYDEQFLLFDGIKAEELLPVIVALDEQGIPFEGVKVMINENNAGWTVRRLFDATRKEHELGRRVIALQELVESCRGMDLSGAEPKARADFRKSLTEAVQLLKSKRYTIETVDKATENLSASTKGVRKLYN
ncbi:MAG: DUF3783 domain-containing protein [Solobacterium sp.]|nr:DUF3783 domain-containing protein [Solobacterium sp.]